MRHSTVGLLARGATKKCLEVARLWNRRMDRVIRCLATAVQYLYEAAGMTRCRLDQCHQFIRAQMIGAGTAHQQRVPLQQPHRHLIELAIGSLSACDVLLALDECRRIENDGVETFTGSRQLVHDLERVSA